MKLRHSRLAIIVVILSLSFRSGDADGPEKYLTEDELGLPETPDVVDLREIGYFGEHKIWCKASQMDKEFAENPFIELDVLRRHICDIADDLRIEGVLRPFYASYKYCNKIKPQVDKLINQLAIRFSDYNEVTRLRLMNSSMPRDKTSACYQKAAYELDIWCISSKNSYFHQFGNLAARACATPWLTPKDIASVIVKVCVGERISIGYNVAAVIPIPDI